MLLDDEEWSQNSSRWIAEKCGVGDDLVLKMREEAGVVSGTSTPRKGKDGKSYPSKKAQGTTPPGASPKAKSGEARSSLRPNKNQGDAKTAPLFWVPGEVWAHQIVFTDHADASRNFFFLNKTGWGVPCPHWHHRTSLSEPTVRG